VDALDREVEELDGNGIRLKFIGDLESLNSALLQRIRAAEFKTLQNTRMTLVIAVAYGGRWDLAQAAQRMAADVADGKLKLDDINADGMSSYLALSGLPELDLLIRSGGEQRVSNFLLWEMAYAELFFTDVLWPDFGTDELTRAFEFFGFRQRRFGQTSEQVEAASC